MPDAPAPPKVPHEIAGDRLIEIAQKKVPEAEPKPPADEVALVPAKKPRAGFLQSLGKLKPLLPILSGGLRLVDHGAAQAVAQLLYLAGGTGNSQAAAEEELQEGLAEIQSSHRDLHHQVLDQSVELQRVQDQITLLRETMERSAVEQTGLADKVRSLNHLIRIVGTAIAVLLVILITLVIYLLVSRH
ncbi:hypothetical protein [Alloacidobacterium sp.]|uniref:hypothetical protein n=1 Tax=Alloacidobacterium sp. TaxID=2951999 RepID=UPI002D799746|nr:hypothetical protein [Alloacidobacterium sp.]